MTKGFGSILIVALFFSPLLVTSVKSEGLYQPKRGCIAHYAKWKTKKMAGAFAVTRNGIGCGWASAPEDMATLRRRAIMNCAKAGKRCRIIQVRKGKAITSPWIPKKRCKLRYETWQNRLGRAAFATTKNGIGCGWAYGKSSLKIAKEDALFICRRHFANCKIFKTK